MLENNMTYDNQNIFAKILRGEIPCTKLYEDDHVLAFPDINPQRKTHIMVIPKGAYTDIADFGTNASDQEITAFYRAVSKISKDQDLQEMGFRTIANTGEFGGQEVPHFHIHLLGGEPVGKLVG